MPDRDAAWPYGLRGTAIGVEQLARSFAVNVTILLGDQDIERNPGNLRRTADARAEGRNRVERGVEFYQRSRAVAQAEGMAFRWRVQMVPGAGHDSILSVEAAAPILAN